MTLRLFMPIFENKMESVKTRTKMEIPKTRKAREKDLLRRNRQSLLFNNREMKAIEAYCAKYKVSNKSKFMRETILTEVLRRFDEDYPSLFEFEKPNLFAK